MEKFKIIILLYLWSTINNTCALTHIQRTELNNLIKIIERQPTRILTPQQNTILKRYISLAGTDPLAKAGMDRLATIKGFNFDQLGQITSPLTKQPLSQPTIQKPTPLTKTTPKITSIAERQLQAPPQLLQEEQPPATPAELQKQFADLEEKLYATLYYNQTEKLLTLDGINDIIETIKKSNPTIENAQLKKQAHIKAVNLLKAIKGQTTLDSHSDDALQKMINSAIGEVPTTTIFTSKLKELPERTLPKDEDEPLYFTSTIESIEKIEQPQKQVFPKPLSTRAQQFVEFSKKEGGSYYFTSRGINPEWLNKAVSVIINGKFKKEDKENVTQALFKMIDILVAEDLREDKSITDDEYKKIVARLETTIINFVDKLEVGREYKLRK